MPAGLQVLRMSINNPILILRTNDLLPDPGTKKHLLVTKKPPATSDLFSFRQKKHSAERLSEQAISLLSDAIKDTIKDTINHQESSWGKWNSWCCKRALDPIRCNIDPVLEFLKLSCFIRGYSTKLHAVIDLQFLVIMKQLAPLQLESIPMLVIK